MLTLTTTGSPVPLEVTPAKLIVAGYTGRDEAAVRAHIAELAAIGIPEPESVPAFYDLPPGLLSSAPVVEVAGASTSGEVEPVIIRRAGRFYLGVGSDHTDRELERTGIAESKAACAKPVGERVVELGTSLDELAWDELTASAEVDGELYQRGSLSGLRHPADTLTRMTETVGELAGDLVVFCGTLPLLAGEFRYGQRWRLRLTLPDGTQLGHEYNVKRRAA
jgi:uncharacterized protein DUF2848